MDKVAEFFKKWSENCRIFINYKPMHSHEDMLRFAEDYYDSRMEEDCLEFFYWWYNQPGNNTEQGFKDWQKLKKQEDATSSN